MIDWQQQLAQARRHPHVALLTRAVPLGLAVAASLFPGRAPFVTPAWVGQLYAIDRGQGLEHVPELALGVAPKRGIVLARSRIDLLRGRYLARPPGRVQRLRRVYYHRRRPEGDWWHHDTPGASVIAAGDRVWIDSRGARLCDRPGDFLCGS